jgi:hypothetical protein
MRPGKKIVVEHFPADKLPAEFRIDVEAGARVRVTVEQEITDRWAPLLDRIDRYHRDNPGRSITTEEAVARIRALRDEWD